MAGVKVTPGIIPLAVAKALADKKFPSHDQEQNLW